MILAVTSYIEIPGHPRSKREYMRLGAQLVDTGISLLRLDGELDGCWLWTYLREHTTSCTHSTDNNPGKNTLAYHAVQAQKSELLVWAAELTDADVLVWIDLGIFLLAGVTPQVICEFMERAGNERAIALPGCWARDHVYDDRYPCWRFAGGLWVVPSEYAIALDAEMKAEYKRHLRETGNVSWEVNVLSRIERRGTSLPLWWYKADHDASLFTNYRQSAYADGRSRHGQEIHV